MRPFVIADHSACAILLFTLWHWPHSSNTMQRKILMIIEPSLLLRQSSSLTRNAFWHWGHLFVTVHLYFTFTQQNWTREALLMQSDLFYPLNHQLGKLQAAKSAWPVCLCLFGLIFSCWVLLATMGVLLGPITSFCWLVLYWVVKLSSLNLLKYYIHSLRLYWDTFAIKHKLSRISN